MRPTDLIIDSFAGGGGASLGIAWATGRAPDIAINHDREALAMHAANHPSTRHVCEDVWHANLRELTGGRRVGLLWASPDCKHFSRAKGAVPVDKDIRSLAWVVVRWASQVRPRVIVLENVREFADWGPLVPRWTCSCGWKGTEGQATLKRRRRRCPRCESTRLRETDDLIPDPDRKGMTFRLFVNRLIGFGYKVQWRNVDAADYGAPTHRRRLFLVARCDGAPIAWPEPTHAAPSKIDAQPLFDSLRPWRTAAECIDWSLPCPSIFDRKRPLAEKTQRRIAMGLGRYVLETPEPFLVACNHGDSNGRRWYPLDEPLRTVQASARGGEALVIPSLVQLGYGERKSQAARVLDLHRPLGTVVAGGQKHALVAAFLAKHYGRSIGGECDSPSGSITGHLHHSMVAAFLSRGNYGEKQWNDVQMPVCTVTTQGNKFHLVYAFLVKYFGAETTIGQQLREPLHTVTSKHRFGLVYVEVAPGCHEPAVAVVIGGERWVIVDIGMRMLQPRELARAQGFPDTYELTGTKTNQVAKIGNSVCPQVVSALVRANVAAEVAR